MDYKEILKHNEKIKETLLGLFGAIGESYYREVIQGFRKELIVTDNEPLLKRTMYKLTHETNDFNQKILFLNVVETNYEKLYLINQHFFQNYFELDCLYVGFFNGYTTLIIKRLIEKFELKTFYRAFDIIIDKYKTKSESESNFNLYGDYIFQKDLENLEYFLKLCANDDKKYARYIEKNNFQAVKWNENMGKHLNKEVIS